MSSSRYASSASVENKGEETEDDLYSSTIYRGVIEADRQRLQRSRAIFAAANLKCRDLSDWEARRLDHKLQWAITWLKNCQPAIPEKIIKDLEKQSTSLKELFDVAEIRQLFWLREQEDATDHPILNVIDHAIAVGRTPSQLSRAFSSGERLFVARLAGIYEQLTGKAPGIGNSNNANHSKLDSPFIRFVREAASRFGLSVPSPQTIKRALIDRKRRSHGSQSAEK